MARDDNNPAALDEIRALASAGHVVRIGWAGGRLPRRLPRGRHRLGTYRLGPARLASDRAPSSTVTSTR